ncbi:MAG TPA: hypothetical protein VEK07_05820 [Polyangiaceae bacterium]|nr:hypothetical protein [Polyangiaceae bacterium]
MPPIENRRRQRSSDPLIALHYQLAHVRHESQMEAIVVADDAGLVVAGAGAWAACEELAAYAPLLVRVCASASARAHETRTAADSGALGAASRVAEMRPHVDIRRVAIEGQTVLVCARGGARRTASLDRAATGVARILRGDA